MTTPVQTPVEHQPRQERTWIYVVAVAILLAVALWAFFAFRSARETARAQDKADELILALEAAGFNAPDRDQIVRVLGEDGGATCSDPNEALNRATLLAQLSNGATGPGDRPIIADSRVLQGQLLIVEVYCPDELDEFQQFVDDLKTSDVAGDGS